MTSAVRAILGAAALCPLGTLAAESDALPTLVVTAGGFEQEIIKAPASITVVTRQELERQRVNSLADALRNIEGVDVDGLDARSNKTGNRTISLRGLPSEYTLLLIDGRRQNVAGTVAPNAFGDSATVFFPPVAAIERIEIIRGPMSTLYGADALGGVVNIITRKPGDEWVGTAILDSTFQSDSEFGGTTGFELYGAGPIVSETLSVQLYGRLIDRAESRITFAGQDTSVDRQRTMGQSPVAADIQTAGGKLLFTPNARNEITLGADYTDQTYNNDRGQMGSIRPGDGYRPELGFEREQYYLGHTGIFDLGVWETTLTHNITRTTGRTIPNAAATAASGRRGMDRTLESENTILDTKFLTALGDHMLTVGGQYWEAELTDGIPDTTFRNSQWGLYVEDEWSITEALALTGGLRYDDHDAFGGQLTPRGYLVWSASDLITLKGGVGQGYKAPFLEQLYDGIIGFGNQGRDPLFGDPDLKPEKSTNYEISAIVNSPIGLFAQTTLFYTEVKDKIERPTAASGVNAEFANIGQAGSRVCRIRRELSDRTRLDHRRQLYLHRQRGHHLERTRHQSGRSIVQCPGAHVERAPDLASDTADQHLPGQRIPQQPSPARQLSRAASRRQRARCQRGVGILQRLQPLQSGWVLQLHG
jgi:outer membrane receptor for ferrienterochelin and colicins